MECKIDVKQGRLTFHIGEHQVELGLCIAIEFFSSSFVYCGVDALTSNEIVK